MAALFRELFRKMTLPNRVQTCRVGRQRGLRFSHRRVASCDGEFALSLADQCLTAIAEISIFAPFTSAAT
jgi:hypothetical protein